MFLGKKTVIAVLLLCAAVLIFVRIQPRPVLTGGTPFSRAVYAENGELLRLTLADDEVFRLYTPLSEISPALIKATIFYEDRLFRYHQGINPFAVARSFWTTYVKKQRVVGGSTITMQLARVLYDIDSATVPGKLNQMLHAVWIEARYSKDEILEAYLNLAPYGHNIEGIGAAGLIYYHSRVKNLSTLQSLTLCVIPQNPNKRVPTNENGWRELKKARDPLMYAWVAAHPEDTDKLSHFSLPVQIYRISDLPWLAPHFADGVLQSYPRVSEYFTTLDLETQKAAERVIKEFVERNAAFGIKNAAALLVNNRTMAVEAAVGSADFFDGAILGQVDGTRSMRSPGSLLKPFIYAVAIDQGLIHPHTLLKDAPRRYGLYSPENSDRGFMGPLFAQDALIQSRNIPAVDLMLELQPPDSLLELLRNSGVKNLRNAEFYGAALALGGFELTMEDAAGLYASLANSGEVKSLRKLQSDVSTVIARANSPEAAYIVTDMLRHNRPPLVRGFRPNLPFPVAYKTGTSFRFRDGWTAGTFGAYTLVVWVGNFNGEGNPNFSGRGAAAPLFFQIVQARMPFITVPEEKGIPPELNVKYVDICSVTGELPVDYCPEAEPTLFIPGVSPITVSDIYLRIPVDIKTGLRACGYDPATTRMEVYEFWPADILELYEKAGIRRKTPPRYMPDCTLDQISYRGAPPVITYPQPRVVYDVNHSPGEGGEIPFIASGGADVDSIYWFVDNKFVGEAANGKPFFWKAVTGGHHLQAVDNLGRSSSIAFDVM